MRRLWISLLVAHILAASEPDPFAFFRPDVEMTASERQALANGSPLVSILPSDGSELAVFSAVPIDGHVTTEVATAWLHRIEQLRRNRYVLASGRFSTPPRVEDLVGLSLDSEDLEGLRRCRPGRCDLKLTAGEIADSQQVIATAGSEWPSAIQTWFRALMVRRVVAYLAGGHAALGAYADHRRPRVLAEAFAGVLHRASFLRAQLPEVVDVAVTCPADPIRKGTGFLYWAKERLGGKAVISVTHVTIVRGNGGNAPEAMALSIQLFATHYLDASLAVTAILRDAAPSGTAFFVYVNRSDVDILRGLWGGIARSLIESRIRKDGPDILRAVNRRIAQGLPPQDALPSQ